MSREYGKLKRHDLKLLIETLYGLEVKNMQEGERGTLVHTDKGIKRLRETRSDEAKILFAASAYEHIYNNGFREISCINRNLNGSYNIRYEKSSYILQDFTKGSVYAVEDSEKAEVVGKALAELHRAGERFVPAPGSRARVDWGKWMEKLKSNSASINKFEELVCLKEKNTEFDRVFMEHINENLDSMKSSYEMLRQNGYLEKVRESMACNQITHGGFKKHAILEEEDGRVFITNLEECSYDICESDIATLLESFSGKNKLRMAAAALEGYSSLKPLNASSINIVTAFLLYPRKFCRIVESAYGRKRNYNEIELVKKLERSIKKEKKKQELADHLLKL